MQVGIDVKFMHTDFGGCGFLIGSIIEESMLTTYSLLLLNILNINNYRKEGSYFKCMSF